MRSVVIGAVAQAIFTGEALVKIGARIGALHGGALRAYLRDPWNQLDAFVVLVGFLEMTPAKIIFAVRPLVTLGGGVRERERELKYFPLTLIPR